MACLAISAFTASIVDCEMYPGRVFVARPASQVIPASTTPAAGACNQSGRPAIQSGESACNTVTPIVAPANVAHAAARTLSSVRFEATGAGTGEEVVMEQNLRLSEVDRRLAGLVERDPFAAIRADSNRIAIDYWLEIRFEMTRPYRNYPAPVIPGN